MQQNNKFHSETISTSWVVYSGEPPVSVNMPLQKYAEKSKKYAKIFQKNGKICRKMTKYAIICQKCAKICQKYTKKIQKAKKCFLKKNNAIN